MKMFFFRYSLKFFILFISLIPFISHAETYGSGVKHIVFCWLHEPGQPEQIEQVIKTSKELKIIPGVIDIQAGKAINSERPIVDDSFDVGLVMTFKNTVDMKNYLNHEEHVSRVNRVLRPLCQRILVYDIAY